MKATWTDEQWRVWRDDRRRKLGAPPYRKRWPWALEAAATLALGALLTAIVGLIGLSQT